MILVIAEQRGGALNRVSWETIAAAQQLAGGMPIRVAVPGGAVSQAAGDLATADVAEVLALEHPALDVYTPDAYVIALQSLIEQSAPAVVLMPHTYQTRDFAPMLATRMRRPMS